MSAAIKEALRTVAELRADMAAVTDALKVKRSIFASENEALLDHEKDTKTALEAAEAAARELVLQHYAETSEVAPVPGAVQVKLYTVLVYDPDRAFAWATEKHMCVIPAKLDVEAFGKIAQAAKLDFVRIEKEPRVTIAKTLDPSLLSDEEAVGA